MPDKDILFYPIGKKISEFVVKNGHTPEGNYTAMIDKPDYETISALADELMDLFISKKIDSVALVYNHFKNAAVQQITVDHILPLIPDKKEAEKPTKAIDFIMEPNKDYLIEKLIPKVVRLKLYSALLDSVAAEHGARTTAMQIATENAGDMIQELQQKYNKARQESITRELIDIVGGAESLR